MPPPRRRASRRPPGRRSGPPWCPRSSLDPSRRSRHRFTFDVQTSVFRVVAPCAAVALGLIVPPQSSRTSAAPLKTALFAAVGTALTQYDVDVERATLVRRGTVTLPANVQEAALHPSRRHLYVGWSSTGAAYGTLGAAPGDRPRHGVSAFRLDGASGLLAADGGPVPLRARPIHLTTDVAGTHLLTAYNNPSGVTVHRLQPGGTIGDEVVQPNPLDGGIYAHFVRVFPSSRAVVLVTRGNGPTETAPEDPGALKVFSYDNGLLRNRASIAPGGGYGFQVRHLDFHPSRPWAFVTLERQNAIDVFRVGDDSLSAAPLFSKTTLADPGHVRPGQTTSAIHVHPNGRFVYVGNRASAPAQGPGAPVSIGGENTIAVFAIDQETGEPTLIQTVDTRGFHPRTFALDPTGRLLVAGNLTPLAVRDGTRIRTVSAGLSVFRIAADGRLEFSRQYPVETDPAGGRLLFWMGMAALE
ncbi:MAG: beta-propeller fold lactonase family protein [Acidobacteria bacterium]|nr:beta-propeller fold lactonase family protein [Acidobacteriota bacterium]